MLLRLDVVVNLELGLIWLLRRSVLQLPDRKQKRGREREGGRDGKLEAEGVDVWDGAQTGRTNQEYKEGGGRRKCKSIEI